MSALWVDTAALARLQRGWEETAERLVAAPTLPSPSVGPLLELFGQLAHHERCFTERLVETLHRGSDALLHVADAVERTDRGTW